MTNQHLRRVSRSEGLHGLPVILHDAHRLPILVRPYAGPPRVQHGEVIFQARVEVQGNVGIQRGFARLQVDGEPDVYRIILKIQFMRY